MIVPADQPFALASLPIVTLLTAGLTGFLLLFLSIAVIDRRRRVSALIGDGGDERLQYRIRAQANLAEYAPLFLILLGLAEAMRGPTAGVIAIAILFLVARVFHAVGMAVPRVNPWRALGTMGNFLALGLAAGFVLWIAAAGG